MQYLYGELLPDDITDDLEWDSGESILWKERAAEQGYLPAQHDLAFRYRHPIPDWEKAVYWTRRAAEQGDEILQKDLGVMYCEGFGVEKDHALAAQWLNRAARTDNPALRLEVQGMLAKLYLTALGPAGELPPATDELPADTLYGLGRMFDVGETVMEDRRMAMEYYQRAAALGHKQAQYHLALGYRDGAGVEKDPMKAALWLARAAAQEVPKACEAFGKCLEDPEVLNVFKNL